MAEFTIKQEPSGPDAPTPETATGPEMPEKFRNAEDPNAALLQAYLELESKRGRGAENTEEEPDPKPEEGTEEAGSNDEETPNEEGEDGDEDDVPEPSALPKEMAPFSEEFAEKGELADESYTKLEEMGYSRDTVDAYIDAVRPLSEEDEVRVVESVGGSEAYEQMVSWAGENLDEGDLARYNKAITRASTADMAAAWLRSRMEAETGREPTLVSGKGTPRSAGAKGYSSMAEMRRDMRDSRYSTDPAYRAKIDKRLAATTAF